MGNQSRFRWVFYIENCETAVTPSSVGDSVTYHSMVQSNPIRPGRHLATLPPHSGYPPSSSLYWMSWISHIDDQQDVVAEPVKQS